MGETLKGRKALCEAVAIHSSMAAQRGDVVMIKMIARSLVERNPEIVSVAVRRTSGTPVVEVGDHQARWIAHGSKLSTPTQVHVPIARGNKPWGTAEVCFAPLVGGPLGFLGSPVLRFFAFFSIISLLSNAIYMNFLLRKYGPGRASGIPERVRATLDTLVEGVLLLDQEQRIAMADQAFARTVGKSAAELEGCRAVDFGWGKPRSESGVTEYPWMQAMREGTRQTGTILELKTADSGHCTMSVNATPIVADDGSSRGALATFDDLSLIERKNVQLKKLLDRLKQSRGEIRRQNEQLRDLATLDPLTSCLNRRPF
jgi:PAS domain S-box-containing protein